LLDLLIVSALLFPFLWIRLFDLKLQSSRVSRR